MTVGVMKLSVLAIGYDGAIARDGRLNEVAREAVSEARRHGVAVVVASGRSLDDLRGATGALDWADAFVAENGAVVAFPNRGSRLLAAQVSIQLRSALER